MKLKNIKSEKGFTIIEVLIVLAIAGLIMLVVFLAVPALQRNSRNSQRNSDASRVSAAVSECLANRNGQVTACNSAATLGQLTTVNVSTSATAPTSSTTEVGVWYGRVCDTNGAAATTTGATARSVAVLFTIEPAITRCITG
jgi:prepilin-type N-terminal cleavage/methylation domain-containing protein